MPMLWRLLLDVGDVRELWPFLVALVVSVSIIVTNAFRPSGHHQCNKQQAPAASVHDWLRAAHQHHTTHC